MYLNDLEKHDTGGETHFPELDLKVKPKKGTAVFWMNVTPDKNVDYRTKHAGLPPSCSTKYGCNIWIREGKYT